MAICTEKEKAYGIARAQTSKQAHLRRHIMRVLGPMGPHYLAKGEEK